MNTVDVRGEVKENSCQTVYKFDDSIDRIGSYSGWVFIKKETGDRRYTLVGKRYAHYFCRAILAAAKDAGYEYTPDDVFVNITKKYENYLEDLALRINDIASRINTYNIVTEMYNLFDIHKEIRSFLDENKGGNQ